jgi:hypothetical protein
MLPNCDNSAARLAAKKRIHNFSATGLWGVLQLSARGSR